MDASAVGGHWSCVAGWGGCAASGSSPACPEKLRGRADCPRPQEGEAARWDFSCPGQLRRGCVSVCVRVCRGGHCQVGGGPGCPGAVSPGSREGCLLRLLRGAPTPAFSLPPATPTLPLAQECARMPPGSPATLARSSPHSRLLSASHLDAGVLPQAGKRGPATCLAPGPRRGHLRWGGAGRRRGAVAQGDRGRPQSEGGGRGLWGPDSVEEQQARSAVREDGGERA